jgi:hypothetical protein
MADNLVGKIGRVTGRITPGELGEVSISIRGGTTAYHAYASLAGEQFAVGTQVVVAEFAPPQTVYVVGALSAGTGPEGYITS